MEKVATFQYEPLQYGCIRLLTLQASSDTDNQLFCSITTHRLRDDLSYKALSYTWGDEQPTLPITLNHTPLLCRPNLWAALHTLRLPDAPRQIWVDAICINQNDTAERGHQVGLMRTIYSKARVVTVWLGESIPGSDEGMGFLRTMHKTITAVQKRKVGSTSLATGTHGEEKGTGRGGPISEPKLRSVHDFESYYRPILKDLKDRNPRLIRGLDAAVALLRRAWWTRIWTLQESVLGREVQVFCGTSMVPIGYFSNLTYFIFSSLNFKTWYGSPVADDVNVRAAWSTANLRDHVSHEGFVRLILALLNSAWQRKASDPRDKVYGIMGLVGQSFDFEPDYNWTVERVYTAATAAIAKRDECLNFLGLISEQCELRNPKLPSWVPDLELHSNVKSDYISSISKARLYAHIYNACGSNYRESPLSLSMALKGIIYNKVTDVGLQAPGRILSDVDEELDAWRAKMESALEQWRSLLPDKELYPCTDEPSARAFWRCVLADLRQGNVHSLYDPGNPTRLSEDEAREIEKLDVNTTDLLSFCASFCRREFNQLRMIEQFNRRFFVTGDGLIGLGPPSLQVGDCICSFFRGDLIYALRPSTNGLWRYVGECYLHGVMDGGHKVERYKGLCDQLFKIE
ncbi:hypothetical protein PG984_013901 [Apiospora sp. TS-2023a]